MYKKNKAYIIWIITLALLYMIFRNTLFGAIFFSAIVMMLISIIIAKYLSDAGIDIIYVALSPLI